MSADADAIYYRILSETSATLHWKPSDIRNKHGLPPPGRVILESQVKLLKEKADILDILRDFMEYLKERASETGGMSPSDARRYRYQACMALSEAARLERVSPKRGPAGQYTGLLGQAVDLDADWKRKGALDARKAHQADAEASKCVDRMPNESASLYGGLRNSCEYKVNVAFCTVGAKAGTSSAAFTCGRFGGAVAIAAYSRATLHTKDAPQVLWAACKDPAFPVDISPGPSGLIHRCR